MRPIRLAVDVAGGDEGCDTVVRGVLDACGTSDVPLQIYLCGNARRIQKNLATAAVPAQCSLTIEPCTGTIAATVSRARAWRSHPATSIIRCIALQKEGTVDVSVSAGDTGILMSSAFFMLGCQPHISRPALGTLLPSLRGTPVLLLDVGANVDCRSEHLVDFARLGHDYVCRTRGIKKPSIGLLNIGTESTKGPLAVKRAAISLKKSRFKYAGFVEGSQVLRGDVDIVVCDGFAGNVLLKSFGSFFKLAAVQLKSRPALLAELTQHMALLNPESYGAAPLLGIHGLVLKAHGSSSAGAIANAIRVAIEMGKQKNVPFTKKSR